LSFIAFFLEQNDAGHREPNSGRSVELLVMKPFSPIFLTFSKAEISLIDFHARQMDYTPVSCKASAGYQ
jgi:hypothetical protein